MRTLAFAILLLTFGSALPEGQCLRPSPDAKSPEEATSKANEELTQTIRERELSKAEVDRRIREKEAAAAKRADTVQVRVHAGGVDPLSKNKTVIMTSEMSKEQLARKDFGDLQRRARESRMAHAQGQSPSAAGNLSASVGSEGSGGGESGSSLTTFLLLAFMAMTGLWFANRQRVT